MVKRLTSISRQVMPSLPVSLAVIRAMRKGPVRRKGIKAHSCQFTVWALDGETLPLGKDASGAMIGFFLARHQPGHAGLTVLSGR